MYAQKVHGVYPLSSPFQQLLPNLRKIIHGFVRPMHTNSNVSQSATARKGKDVNTFSLTEVIEGLIQSSTSSTPTCIAIPLHKPWKCRMKAVSVIRHKIKLLGSRVWMAWIRWISLSTKQGSQIFPVLAFPSPSFLTPPQKNIILGLQDLHRLSVTPTERLLWWRHKDKTTRSASFIST